MIFAIGIPTASADVFIQNDRKYIGDDGAIHVVGEIHNNLDAPLRQIHIFVTLYDVNNHIIATKETTSLVNIIMPTMKGPFDLVLTDHKLKKTDKYSIEIDYKVSPPKSQVIDITSSELKRDSQNNLMILGTVANKGEITANTVSVVATLYDKDGNVAITSRIHPEPDYLRADDEVFFLVPVIDQKQTVGITDYTLVAESEEYAAVPEFPLGSAILLTASVSTYIGITRFATGSIANLISAANPK